MYILISGRPKSGWSSLVQSQRNASETSALTSVCLEWNIMYFMNINYIILILNIADVVQNARKGDLPDDENLKVSIRFIYALICHVNFVQAFILFLEILTVHFQFDGFSELFYYIAYICMNNAVTF